MTTPDTSLEAFKEVRDSGDADNLRRRVAKEIAGDPRTTNELGKAIPDHSANAIRPRVNELIRMGCVKRDGKRRNPSGHDAYINHITPRGREYIHGLIDPDPGPTVSELQSKIVAIAREVVRGRADVDVLQIAIENHDKARRRADPEWEP